MKYLHRGGLDSAQIDDCLTKLTEVDTENQSVDEQKHNTEARGTLWNFLENECDLEERELVRDILLPTAAGLALSLPQVRIANTNTNTNANTNTNTNKTYVNLLFSLPKVSNISSDQKGIDITSVPNWGEKV